MIATVPAARGLLRRPAVWLIAAAWTLAIGAQSAGMGATLHHDALVHAGWTGAAVFVAVWQVHVVAMMLPSSMPMLRLFGRVAARQDRPHVARSSFVAGYLAVWTAFGVVAFAGDVVVHRLVESVPGLGARPWLVAGTVVFGAGVFQLSGLKDRCLQECRLPSSYLRRHYRQGSAAAFRLGAGHGLFCLGCCWALMLVLFAVGVTNVAWMAPFAALMVVEKVASWGDRVVVPVGVVLMVVGSLLMVSL